jgi:hypothetical protein
VPVAQANKPASWPRTRSFRRVIPRVTANSRRHVACIAARMAHPVFAGWLVSIIVYAAQGSSGALLQITTPLGGAQTRTAPALGHEIELSTTLSKRTVEMAQKAAGLAESNLDDLASRSRIAALLPEARLRVARTEDDRNDDDNSASYTAPNRWHWEARVSWRLDRIVYSGEEPTLERLRLEHAEARARLTHRTLEALFAWERARLDAHQGDSVEAHLRLRETECTLDALTGGWFTRRIEK